MTKPTAAQKRAFEKVIGDLGTKIAQVAETVEKLHISLEGVNLAFAHLGVALTAAHQRCQFAAQTNDAGNFSLSNPAAVPMTQMQSVTAGVNSNYEGRIAGLGLGPGGSGGLKVTEEVDASGDGMMIVE